MRGGLIETGGLFELGGGGRGGGGGGGLFNLEKTMVSVLHKEGRIQSRKAQVQQGWRPGSRGSESNSNFQLVNKPSRISPHEVFQS